MKSGAGGDRAHDAGVVEETGSLAEILEEARMLSQPAQVLSAFLVVVPFSAGFPPLGALTRILYVATFVFALTALVLFTAPAAQHRIERPLRDRVKFKVRATRTLIAGTASLSVSLVFAALLVVKVALGGAASVLVAVLVAALVLVSWWVIPIMLKRSGAE